MQISQKKADAQESKLKKAMAKVRAVRENKTTQMLARAAGGIGAGAAAAGKLDGLLNVIPGGHLSHADYTKGPSGFMYKRFMLTTLAAGASAYFLDGPEGSAATPTLAALAGRAYAQHLATYYGISGAVSAEQLVADVGKDGAAKVAAAKGYPQV